MINRFAVVTLVAALSGCAPGLHSGRAAVEIPTGFPRQCAADETQVMLLGTYHFANPGADVIRTDVDDVLTSRRQSEIEELVTRLARWAPEMVAVEWPFSFMDSTHARYQRFRAGTLRPSRNEVVQIGFRLAARLGHDAVYPIDYQMSPGNDSIGALLDRRPDMKRRMDSIQAVMQAAADRDAPRRRATSIIAHLREGNTEEALHRGNSLGMFGSFIAAGEGDNYGGPQLLARWYERNFRMVHNLTRLVRPGMRRVLVLVGSGHVPPIRNILDESPQFCPVSPLPLLQ